MASELLQFVLEQEQFRKPRLPSLYSDFRYLRTTNPNGFAANLAAWKDVLRAATERGLAGDDHLVLPVTDTLVSQLATREWGRPLALATVVDEAVAARELYPLDLFCSQSTSIYYRSWVGALLSWGLAAVGLGSSTPSKPRLQNGKFVVVAAVEATARSVLARASARSSRTGRIFTPALFAAEFTPELSETDVTVLIKFLARDLGAAAASDGTTLKILAPGDSATITDADTSIAELKAHQHMLQARVEELSSAVTADTNKARNALSRKNPTLARAALRRRKATEATLESRAANLVQIDEILARIEQAADNIELVRVLARGGEVLHGLNREVGGVKRVDAVMESLREGMDDVEEISRVVAEGQAHVDEDEVEDELEAMLRQETEAAERRRVEQLPSAPKEKEEAAQQRAGGGKVQEKEREKEKQEPGGSPQTAEGTELEADAPAAEPVPIT